MTLFYQICSTSDQRLRFSGFWKTKIWFESGEMRRKKNQLLVWFLTRDLKKFMTGFSSGSPSSSASGCSWLWGAVSSCGVGWALGLSCCGEAWGSGFRGPGSCAPSQRVSQPLSSSSYVRRLNRSIETGAQFRPCLCLLAARQQSAFD